ncbi:hypothetical protein LCGC14_0510090 [marine sediment metagenome]|uniref:Uncharacterized protein n=1 Tax=marine sediment metagenome TaxID=412755 RepID=A0A0F9V9T1_9ZZZZ
MTPGISLKPSSFVEGGIVPVDRNVTWKEARFNLFDYVKKSGEKVASTVALRVTFVEDDGTESEQQYSVGDPERFQPSEDGKELVAVGDAVALSKSSNYYLLMNALVNAGFPENRLGEDTSVLDGLYTYNIGLPEPKRSGLARPAVADGETVRERVLSVPSQILKLPWDKKGGAKTSAKAKASETEATDDEVIARALKFVADALGEDESIIRKDLAVKVFKDLAKDPMKDAVAGLIFKDEFQVQLLAAGYTLDGETISKS